VVYEFVFTPAKQLPVRARYNRKKYDFVVEYLLQLLCRYKKAIEIDTKPIQKIRKTT
jgi:hypothetical protein